MIMKGYLILSIICASLHRINAQAGCIARGGSCHNSAMTCCAGEVEHDDSLCPYFSQFQSCCFPEAKCEDLGHFCIGARNHQCPADRLSMGFCNGPRICCKDDLRRTNGRGNPAPPPVCSVEGQKDACNVIADPGVKTPTGPKLVEWGFTTVGDDGSSPFDNLYDTCLGYEIQTTTSEFLCNSHRVCLHEMIPRFLRCYRRLCGPFWVLNIASDSNGQFWKQHCRGNAVDVISPNSCIPLYKAQKYLCHVLDGYPTYFDSTADGSTTNNVLNCQWTR